MRSIAVGPAVHSEGRICDPQVKSLRVKVRISVRVSLRVSAEV